MVSSTVGKRLLGRWLTPFPRNPAASRVRGTAHGAANRQQQCFRDPARTYGFYSLFLPGSCMFICVACMNYIVSQCL